MPGSHSQSERDELPAGDDDDAGQLEQAPADVAPSCDENVPALQLLHTVDPLSSAYLPGSQSTQDWLPEAVL